MLPITFALGSAQTVIFAIVAPSFVGSHAVIYTDAARFWLTGRDPWSAGPPAVIFAGPPTMLVPFLPFVDLPGDVTRAVWVIGGGLVTIWSLRRLRLPAYWIGFPPIVGAVILGHPETLILWVLVLGLTADPHGLLSGVAATVKPYVGFALLAERRWAAIALGIVLVTFSLPFLPWARFLAELPEISANLARQNVGDSTFGQPVLIPIALVALLSLGPRRGLWLATPLVWPFAQPIYKIMTVPQLSRVMALVWALSFPGATLLGIILEAALIGIQRHRRLPGWLAAGIGPAAEGLGPDPGWGPWLRRRASVDVVAA